MQTVTTYVPRDAETCWRVFIDIPRLVRWVPGLRHAEILTKARGLPAEVHFQFGQSLAYTLVYSYDRERREIHWEPKLGPRDGVSGWVRFDPEASGTRITYALAHGDGRGAAEREVGDLERLVAAFASWLVSTS